MSKNVCAAADCYVIGGEGNIEDSLCTNFLVTCRRIESGAHGVRARCKWWEEGFSDVYLQEDGIPRDFLNSLRPSILTYFVTTNIHPFTPDLVSLTSGDLGGVPDE